jgi:Ca2+-binding EF-hand superfamily protein
MRRATTGVLALSTFFLAGLATAQTDVREQRFAQRDHDRDGYLTLSEYGGHPGNFRALDRSGDNRLSRDEFVRRGGGGGGPVIALPDEFAYLDLNGDAWLSRAEWYGQSVPFERVDRNRDNRISRDEQLTLPVVDDRQTMFYGRDTNSDGVIARREWRDEDIAFNRADGNNDGVVSLREYMDMPLRSTDRDVRFERMDRNADGRLSRGEWRTEAGAFYSADRNRDGIVTSREYRDYAVDGDYVKEVAVERDRFSLMDDNRDGYVTRAEWNGTLDAFVRADRNRDGRVSRSELYN